MGCATIASALWLVHCCYYYPPPPPPPSLQKLQQVKVYHSVGFGKHSTSLLSAVGRKAKDDPRYQKFFKMKRLVSIVTLEQDRPDCSQSDSPNCPVFLIKIPSWIVALLSWFLQWPVSVLTRQSLILALLSWFGPVNVLSWFLQ